MGFINRGIAEEPRIVQVDPLLDAWTLGLQTSLFKLTMRSNAKSAMEEPRDKNPVSKLWQKIGQNALMLNRLSEFIKLAEIAITATLGSVEDERTFSTLGFMKSKVRNRLGGHLDTCMKMFSQPFFK
jgi:DNA primase large subunit